MEIPTYSEIVEQQIICLLNEGRPGAAGNKLAANVETLSSKKFSELNKKITQHSIFVNKKISPFPIPKGGNCSRHGISGGHGHK